MTPAANLHKLRQRDAKFIQLEELREFKQGESQDHAKPSNWEGGSKNNFNQKESKPIRFSGYTILNALR